MTDLVYGSLANGKTRPVWRRGLAIAASSLVGLLSVSTIVSNAEPSYAQNIVVINGRGFGHGVGLAQDGAYWMGRAGRSATEILRLFFPGTVIAKRGGTVRVPLGGGGSAQLGFPNGGSIGALRVPAGGSVSVRASGGEVIASVLMGSSTGGEAATVSAPTATAPTATAPTAPTAPTGLSSVRANALNVDQVAPPAVTPSAVGNAVAVHMEAGDRASQVERDRSAVVAFSTIRNDPALRDSTLANGNGLSSTNQASNSQNEIVNGVERFQADTPIVSSVVTAPAASLATPTSNPAAPTNPPSEPAVTSPAQSNPVPTAPLSAGATASVAGAVTPAPDGAIPSVPIVTSVDSGGVSGAVATSVQPSASGQNDPNISETGPLSKPGSGTTQGSSLSASSGGATIAFNGRRYRGSIEFNGGGGSLRITNSVDLEDYLKGMGEILTPSWPSAALQSQAIAARTYALRTMAIDGQVCPTQRCQVYLGAQAEYSKMNSAVDATRGKVLTYGGKLAATFYSASGGGTIATPEEGFGGGSSQQPYLKAGSYPTGDVLAWTVRMPLSEVARRVGYGGSPRGVTVTRVGASGRALEVTVDGSSGPLRVGGPKFDAALGLKSTFFTINEPVFGSSGSDLGVGGGGFGSGSGSAGSSSDLTSALAALGLSNATPGAGLEEQSRLVAVADPDFAAGAATTLPPTALIPSEIASSNVGQSSPYFSSGGFDTAASSAGFSVSSGLVADTTSVPSTAASAPKPTQPDNSAGSTIEAINLPEQKPSSSSSDVAFFAVPAALLGFVGVGLRRRMKANKSANPSPPRNRAASPRPRPTSRPDGFDRPMRPSRIDQPDRPVRRSPPSSSRPGSRPTDASRTRGTEPQQRRPNPNRSNPNRSNIRPPLEGDPSRPVPQPSADAVLRDSSFSEEP